jgi:hypothetical protein
MNDQQNFYRSKAEKAARVQSKNAKISKRPAVKKYFLFLL